MRSCRWQRPSSSAPLIGAPPGFVASRLIATVDDHLIELTLSLAAAYGTYLVADRIDQSGIIATVVAGLVIGNYGRALGMSARSREALDTVWEFFAFLVTAIVFLLDRRSRSASASWPTRCRGSAGASSRSSSAGRMVVYGLLGRRVAIDAADRPSPGLPLAWLHVLFWGGLRGAVADRAGPVAADRLPGAALLQEITFGVVLFTLLVQGTTIEWVIDRVGAGAPSGRAELGPASAPPASRRPQRAC